MTPSPLKRLNSHEPWRSPSWPQQVQLDAHSLELFCKGLGLQFLINMLVQASPLMLLPAVDDMNLLGALSQNQDGA
jgi:hypothetical protein